MSINFYRKIDKIMGNILCRILAKIPRQQSNEINSVLVIKLWAIGESILTLPMIKAIKEKNPQTKITILARKRNKAVYEGQTFIDNVILFEPEHLMQIARMHKKFDLAIDCEPYLNISAILGRWLAKTQKGFSHNTRAKLYDTKIDYNDKQHVVKTYLDLGSIIGADKLVKLRYSTEDAKTVTELLKQHHITKKDFVVGMCQSVAESGKNRMWPTENYAKVADALTEEYGAKIILVGAKSDNENNNEIIKLSKNKTNIFNFAGKTTLKQLFNLVENCKLFISNDTGPMHIAAAQGVRTIGIFGPNLPLRFAPYGQQNISLYTKQECSPCINVHNGSFPECHNKIKGKCLREINATKVMEAVRKCLT